MIRVHMVYLGGDLRKYWCESGEVRQEGEKANMKCISGPITDWQPGLNPSDSLWNMRRTLLQSCPTCGTGTPKNWSSHFHSSFIPNISRMICMHTKSSVAHVFSLVCDGHVIAEGMRKGPMTRIPQDLLLFWFFIWYISPDQKIFIASKGFCGMSELAYWFFFFLLLDLQGFLYSCLTLSTFNSQDSPISYPILNNVSLLTVLNALNLGCFNSDLLSTAHLFLNSSPPNHFVAFIKPSLITENPCPWNLISTKKCA